VVGDPVREGVRGPAEHPLDVRADLRLGRARGAEDVQGVIGELAGMLWAITVVASSRVSSWKRAGEPSAAAMAAGSMIGTPVSPKGAATTCLVRTESAHHRALEANPLGRRTAQSDPDSRSTSSRVRRAIRVGPKGRVATPGEENSTTRRPRLRR
jgi:hypothetical protein